MSALPRLDPALHAVLCGALALLFGWAAAHKLRDPAKFRAALAAYDLLPPVLVSAAAAAVIAAEIAIAVELLTGGSAAALAGALLLGVYTAAIAVNLRRGRRRIDCGCMGAAGRRSLSGDLLLRNGVLILAALFSALPAGSRHLQWVDGVTIVSGVLSLALLYAAADGLIGFPSFQER